MMKLKYNPEAIKTIRTDRKLNQREFAELIGGTVQRQHVAAWEKGIVPGIKLLLQVANALGHTSLDAFIVKENYQSENGIEAHSENIASG